MKNYGQILNGIKGTPWLITQEGLDMILEIVDRRRNGLKLDEEEIRIRLGGSGRGGDNQSEAAGGVGLIPLYGPIFPKANMMTEMSGATSLEAFRSDFAMLLNDPRVETIVMDIDSPGGSAFMVPETADFIYEATKVKPVIAVANSMAASAALFLGSQASEFYVTDSGLVGSLGTILAHDSIEGLQEKAGIKTTLITATDSPYKAELAAEFDLSAEALAEAQKMVDQINDGFVNAVARGRNTTVTDVKANYGKGRVLTAKDALAVGMVDGIKTLDAVLGEALSNGGKLSTAARASKLRNLSPTPNLYDPNAPHGEPGTGEPPQVDTTIHPETVEDDYSNGERYEKPEVEEYAMKREQLLQLATRLNIVGADKLDDEALATAVSNSLGTVLDQNDELTEAVAQAERTRSFAQDYPDEYEELVQNRNARQKGDAALFANSFSRLKDDSGAETKFGLSIPVREKLEEAHLAMVAGNFGPNELAEIVNMVASRSAVVEFGEKGSSRLGEDANEEYKPTGDRVEDRKKFANAVKTLMEEDSLDRKAAIAEASTRYPELATAYAQN
jgi:capsid assembly protease